MELGETKVYGYRFELRTRGGPNGERIIGDWSTKFLQSHPSDFLNAEIRNAVELVPAKKGEEPIAYYSEMKKRWSENWTEEITTFDPREQSNMEHRNVIPLVEGEEIDVEFDPDEFEPKSPSDI